MPLNAPYVAIEIVSGDTVSELWDKLTEYQAIGVPHTWVANPDRRTSPPSAREV